jgi:hypothetical protein
MLIDKNATIIDALVNMVILQLFWRQFPHGFAGSAHCSNVLLAVFDKFRYEIVTVWRNAASTNQSSTTMIFAHFSSGESSDIF